MNLLPRSFATMALAVAAVPGVAPLAAPFHQPGHGTAHTQPHLAGHPVGHLAGHVAGKAAPASARVATPTAGGWTEQNPASPAVLGAAGFAAVSLSETFGGHYVVEDVRHAASQVVEGENFRLKLRIAQLQNEVLGARKDCTVVVWSRPWLKPADQLTSADCQNVDTAVPAAPAAPAVGAKVVVADAEVVAPKHACPHGKAEKVTKTEKPGKASVRV
jgi:hypothetical protein